MSMVSTRISLPHWKWSSRMRVTLVISPAVSGSRGWWTATPDPFKEASAAFKGILSFLSRSYSPGDVAGEGEGRGRQGQAIDPHTRVSLTEFGDFMLARFGKA